MAKAKKDPKPVRKTHKTEKPTNLSITRSYGSFTAYWKQGDSNYSSGQQLQYQVNGGKWTDVSIGAGAKNKTFLTVNFANYWPYTYAKLTSVGIRVRGIRSPWRKTTTKKITMYETSWSDWSYSTYWFGAPAAPSISATPDENLENVCTFAWSAANPSDTGYQMSYIEWQSVLLRDSAEVDGARAFGVYAVQRLSGTTGASGSWATPETYTPSGSTGYTRWFAVRSRGCAGDSGWSYAKCVYAIPYASTMKSATASIGSYGGYTVNASWDSPSSNAHPIEKTEVLYSIVTPNAGMVCPDDASFTSVKTQGDTWAVDSASFSIDTTVGFDKCLFVRVDNHWRKFPSYGTPYLVSGGIGALTAPTITSIESDAVTHQVTVEANNGSSVPDSFLVIRIYTNDDPDGKDIGVIPHGETTVNVQCPDWGSGEGVAFGVYAVVGSYSPSTPKTGGAVTYYAITKRMQSEVVKRGGVVPIAPTNVAVSPTDISGTVRVTFDWTWSQANGAEISWANHEDAWESTDEPDTYEISSIRASAWNISGLEPGMVWYVRVRLFAGTGENKNYGAYSPIIPIDLASAPSIPTLDLQPPVITEDGVVTASWAYSTGDGTPQAYAEIAEVTEVEGQNVYTPIASVQTAQHADIPAHDEIRTWSYGETHTLVVRVVSASGRASDDWSNPVSVYIAEPLTAEITQTSLIEETITTDGVSRVVKSMKAMPLSVTVEGAGTSGTTNVMIVRSGDYRAKRPDETEFNGYDGETIALWSQVGEAQIIFNQGAPEIIGHLDDEGKYLLIATVQDSLGQSAEATIPFEVHWTHQAIVPSATVEMSEDENIAILTPVAPEGTVTGDVCDIYRLSTDRPELIYQGAAWGTQYVDPFPAIGEHGGHRFVFRTADGDYATETGFAWFDTDEEQDDIFESDYNIINFGDGVVYLQYDIDISNSWSKDFKETKYLGGSVQGDWNPAVSRTSSVSSVVVLSEDPELIESLRRLATYSGVCHVRTKDGSSYSADVQVSEDYKVSNGHKLASFSLKITRVDAETPDGMTLAEWRRGQEEA